MMDKFDLKRAYRELYSASAREFHVVDVPAMCYLAIDGSGDPNTSAEYVSAVEALFTIAYTIKAHSRTALGLDFVVPPLEGLWWVPDMATFSVGDKSAWDWTMMIMQPVEVTDEVLMEAKASASAKRSLPALDRLRLERFAEGLAVQVLHIGPYSAEGPTISALHDFIGEQGRELAGKHHEIYLGDPARSAPERLKTIIRQPMR